MSMASEQNWTVFEGNPDARAVFGRGDGGGAGSGASAAGSGPSPQQALNAGGGGGPPAGSHRQQNDVDVELLLSEDDQESQQNGEALGAAGGEDAQQQQAEAQRSYRDAAVLGEEESALVWARECAELITADLDDGLTFVAEEAELGVDHMVFKQSLRQRPSQAWTRAEICALKQSEYLEALDEEAEKEAAAAAQRGRITLCVEEETTGSVAHAAESDATRILAIFTRAAAGGSKISKNMARKGLFSYNPLTRGRASATLTYSTSSCCEEVRAMYARTALAPATVTLPAGATTLKLRVSRANTKPPVTFTLLAGDALPVQVAAATERKLSALRRQATVMKVERTPLRGRTTVTLTLHELPQQLTQEPFLLLHGERALITFPKGPPTCDRCWCTGHSRTQGCPHALAAASAECSSCGQKGHAAAGCWLAEKECFHCHQRGHLLKQCPTRTCYSCRQPGHIAADCPQRAPKEKASKKQKGGARAAQPAAAAKAAQPAAAATEVAQPAAAVAEAEQPVTAAGEEVEMTTAPPPVDKRKREEGEEEEAKATPVDPTVQAERRDRAARLMGELGVERTVKIDPKKNRIVLEPRGRGATSHTTILERDGQARMLTALLAVFSEGGNDESALAAAERVRPTQAELEAAEAADTEAGNQPPPPKKQQAAAKEASGQQQARKARRQGATAGGGAGTVVAGFRLQQERQQQQQERQQQQLLH